MGNWDVSKPNKDREPCAELATKTCNKQIASKLEDAELARDSEETCNNKQVISKLVASEDCISRQAAKEAVKRASASGTVQMLLMEILDGMPSVNPMPCEDVISRQAAIDALKNLEDLQGRNVFTKNGLYPWNVIAQLPSVTPKQRTGHWIIISQTDMYCSECNEIEHLDTSRKFCAYCGTRMVESQAEKE